MKLWILVFSVLSLGMMGSDAQDFVRSKTDDGTRGSTWLPEALIQQFGKKPTMLMASCEDMGKAKYYVVNYSKRPKGMGSVWTGFFKAEGEKAELLGESLSAFPFGRYIEDEEIVDALWSDFIKRWVKQDGRSTVQEKLDHRAGMQMTHEEAAHFKEAGFKIPKNVQVVDVYQQSKEK